MVWSLYICLNDSDINSGMEKLCTWYFVLLAVVCWLLCCVALACFFLLLWYHSLTHLLTYSLTTYSSLLFVCLFVGSLGGWSFSYKAVSASWELRLTDKLRRELVSVKGIIDSLSLESSRVELNWVSEWVSGVMELDQVIHKEGWLRKKGSRVNLWSERYFVLRGPCLFYFMKSTDTVWVELASFSCCMTISNVLHYVLCVLLYFNL
jgi:hypothetical protein